MNAISPHSNRPPSPTPPEKSVEQTIAENIFKNHFSTQTLQIPHSWISPVEVITGKSEPYSHIFFNNNGKKVIGENYDVLLDHTNHWDRGICVAHRTTKKMYKFEVPTSWIKPWITKEDLDVCIANDKLYCLWIDFQPRRASYLWIFDLSLEGKMTHICFPTDLMARKELFVDSRYAVWLEYSETEPAQPRVRWVDHTLAWSARAHSICLPQDHGIPQKLNLVGSCVSVIFSTYEGKKPLWLRLAYEITTGELKQKHFYPRTHAGKCLLLNDRIAFIEYTHDFHSAYIESFNGSPPSEEKSPLRTAN